MELIDCELCEQEIIVSDEIGFGEPCTLTKLLQVYQHKNQTERAKLLWTIAEIQAGFHNTRFVGRTSDEETTAP